MKCQDASDLGFRKRLVGSMVGVAWWLQARPSLGLPLISCVNLGQCLCFLEPAEPHLLVAELGG